MKRYLKTKLENVSMKLSEFPHHITYHITNIVPSNSGVPKQPMSSRFGVLDLPRSSHYGVLELPTSSHSGVLDLPVGLSQPTTGDYFTPYHYDIIT